jgi:hypothetical protein
METAKEPHSQLTQLANLMNSMSLRRLPTPHNNNNNNNNKPHLSSSNNNNNNREGGASLESLVHAARGVVVEGEKGTILTTISNDRLMLASLSAAVE